jgi:2-oxoisovalerate dehydrogenase E2 component (dihydrolipoyl transacylase)
MDRALLASLKAAAEAGEAAEAAFEAADLLGHRDTAMDLAGSAAFSGEGSVVRGNEPRKREERLEAVPDRQERPQEARKEIIKASPAVRTMAGRLGVRLEDVRPTGEGGRVTQQDVQNAVMAQKGPAGVQAGAASSENTPTTRSSGGSAAPSPTPPKAALVGSGERSKIPEITKVEFGRTRKVMYRAMGDMAHVPHFG